MKRNGYRLAIVICLLAISITGMGFTRLKVEEMDESTKALYMKTIDGKDKNLVEEENITDSMDSKIDIGITVFTLLAGDNRICSFKTSAEVEDIIASVKDKFSKAEENTTIKETLIVEDLDIIREQVKLSDIKTKEQVLTYIETGLEELAAYKLEEEQNFFTIGKTFNMTIEDLERLNPEKDGTALAIGDEIIVKKTKPLMTVRTTSEIESTKQTDYKIITEEDPDMYDTETKVKVEGQAGENKLITRQVKENGKTIEEELVSEEVVKEPIDQISLKGSKKKPKTTASGNFQMPTRGRLSSSFGARWGRMHRGIDIAKDQGSDIMAADGGKVSFSGVKGTYGNMIEIDHENGYKTRYAHASRLILKAGDRVAQGQVIAKVGSTGRSTGPHLHFEVIKNGEYKNPLNYVN